MGRPDQENQQQNDTLETNNRHKLSKENKDANNTLLHSAESASLSSQTEVKSRYHRQINDHGTSLPLSIERVGVEVENESSLNTNERRISRPLGKDDLVNLSPSGLRSSSHRRDSSISFVSCRFGSETQTSAFHVEDSTSHENGVITLSRKCLVLIIVIVCCIFIGLGVTIWKFV